MILASPTRGASSRRTAGSGPRVCSPASGSRSSGSGRGTRSRSCRRSSSSCARRCRSRSTAFLAGLARRSSRSRSSCTTGPCAGCHASGFATSSTSARHRARRHSGKISDRLLARYGRAHVQPGREQALDYAERWIIDRQELDGSWGGIQPPWVWSLIALACRGHGSDSPYLHRGLEGWKRFLDRGRGQASPGGLPVTRLGYGTCAPRAPRGRSHDGRARRRAGRRLDARRGGTPAWRLGRPRARVSSRAAGRSSTTTTSIPTSTTSR